MSDTERLGKQSASTAYRRRRCSGSVNLIRELRAAGKLTETPPSPDAQSGTRVHAAWSLSPSVDAQLGSLSLSSRETETLERLTRMERLVVADWAGSDAYTLLGREQRLWLHDGLDPVHSGQFDVAYGTIHSRRMLILDGKTLFDEVDAAARNDQLRELVALARFNFEFCTEFTVAILQPWVSAKPSVAVYDQAEAELSLRMLRAAIADSADPAAPRTPGAWCQYCPAISQCEEARSHIGHTYRLAKRIQDGGFTIPLGESGARFLESIKTAETVLAAMKAAYREILSSDPTAVPGWYMKSGSAVREITDIAAALAIARDLGLPDSSLVKATRLALGAFQDLIGQALHLRGTALQERFDQLFGATITLKTNAPELARESPRRGRHKELPPSKDAKPA